MSSFRMSNQEPSVGFAEIQTASGSEQEAEVVMWPRLNNVERAYHDIYRDFVKYALHNSGYMLDLDIDPAPIPQSSAALEAYLGPPW